MKISSVRSTIMETPQFVWVTAFTVLLLAAFMLSPEFASAAEVGETAISKVLCRIITGLTGGIGKGISTVALIFLAVGLFVGKISWGVAIAVGIGIGGIFGAEDIVNWVAGDAKQDCTAVLGSGQK